jgi:Tol biopolymer transport system component
MAERVTLLTSRAAIVFQLGCLVLAAGNASLAQESEQGRPTLPGKIYLQASWQTDENDKSSTRSSTIALDPNTGKFVDLGIPGHGPRVSPDGKRIAISLPGAKINDQSTKDIYDIHVLDLNNFETLHIAENASLAMWSGDGKQLIYNVGKMGGDNGEDVGWRGLGRSVLLTSKEVRQLGVPKTDEIDDCSADGQWLVTVSDRHPPLGSGYQLYAMHPDGSGQIRLTEGPGLNCYPRFSPVKNQIVYHFSRKGVAALRVVDVDGKNRRELLKSDDGKASPECAAWSPDGKWLAVVRFDWSTDETGRHVLNDPADANYRLEIIDLDGKSLGVVELDGVIKVTWLGHPDWR